MLLRPDYLDMSVTFGEQTITTRSGHPAGSGHGMAKDRRRTRLHLAVLVAGILAGVPAAASAQPLPVIVEVEAPAERPLTPDPAPGPAAPPADEPTGPLPLTGSDALRWLRDAAAFLTAGVVLVIAAREPTRQPTARRHPQ